MATKPINVEATLAAARTAHIVGALSQWLSARQQWAPLALRLPLGVIFFGHGAQKMLGWFGGYGWHGTMQYFTNSLHISDSACCDRNPSRILGRPCAARRGFHAVRGFAHSSGGACGRNNGSFTQRLLLELDE